MNRRAKSVWTLLVLFLVVPHAWCWVIGDSQPERIGFDFTDRIPQYPDGDRGAPNHLFIHQYPFPGQGLVTAVIYRNDREVIHPEISETMTLLILRPVTGGWKIIHRVTLPDDDDPPAVEGITTVRLDPPLPVEAGDIFAHWQSGLRPTGPVPLNADEAFVEGRSVGQFGFNFSDTEIGHVIMNRGFTGHRDYFMNLVFEPALAIDDYSPAGTLPARDQ